MPKSKMPENAVVDECPTVVNSGKIANLDVAAPETGALRDLGNTPVRRL